MMIDDNVMLSDVGSKYYIHSRDENDLKRYPLSVSKDWLYSPSVLLFTEYLFCDIYAFEKERESVENSKRQKKASRKPLLAELLIELEKENILHTTDKWKILLDEDIRNNIIQRTKEDIQYAKKIRQELKGDYIQVKRHGYHPTSFNSQIAVAENSGLRIMATSYNVPFIEWKARGDLNRLGITNKEIQTSIKLMKLPEWYVPCPTIIEKIPHRHPNSNEWWIKWREKERIRTIDNFKAFLNYRRRILSANLQWKRQFEQNYYKKLEEEIEDKEIEILMKEQVEFAQKIIEKSENIVDLSADIVEKILTGAICMGGFRGMSVQLASILLSPVIKVVGRHSIWKIALKGERPIVPTSFTIFGYSPLKITLAKTILSRRISRRKWNE